MRGRRGGPDRFLHWKLVLLFLGAGFFFAGVATGRDWAVALAIGFFAAGVLLRLLSQRAGAEERGEEAE